LPKRPFHRLLTLLFYLFATLQFVRFYVVSPHFYLKMPDYLHGHERLPFQERVLPIFLMWPINHSAIIMRAVDRPISLDPGENSAATTKTIAFYIVSLIAVSIAGFYLVRLYRLVTATGSLAMLVYPTFLVICIWTYVIHVDANYSYPYDMPALAFFTAGLYYIYKRRFLPLLFVVLTGTFNRETTLFLIGIYILDAASNPAPPDRPRLAERFRPELVPWGRVLLLTAVWLAIKLPLSHHFAHNSTAEDYIRIRENIGRLKPRLLPSLLNMCGYLLPVVWLFRDRLRPLRFANYLYILPFWIAIMFVSGVILETRIYGELSSFVAIAVVLLLEHHVRCLHSDEPSQLSLQSEEDAFVQSNAA
jgi:hypothetical protein